MSHRASPSHVMESAPDKRCYEMHVVVDCEQHAFEDFKERARAVGQKALAIQIDCVEPGGRLEIMTAGRSIGSAEEAVAAVEGLAAVLAADDGYPTLRTRVELAPWHPETPKKKKDIVGADGYFEGHVHLSVPRNALGDTLIERQQAAAEQGYAVELSRNANKGPNQYGETPYMVTLRQRGVVLSQFEKSIGCVEDEFYGLTDSESSVIEYVVYDRMHDGETNET